MEEEKPEEQNPEGTKGFPEVEKEEVSESVDEDVDADGISSYVKSDAMWNNLLLAALYGVIVYGYVTAFSQIATFSSLVLIIHYSLIVFFFLNRDYPKQVSKKSADWAFALLGTWLPFLIMPVSGSIILLEILQFIAMITSVCAVISLNNSYGIVPAVRTIKTGFMYKLVRHPLYFTYAVSFSCFVLNNLSIANVALLAVMLVSNVMRIKAEEEILSEEPAYQLYQERVRWRLIPYVW